MAKKRAKAKAKKGSRVQRPVARGKKRTVKKSIKKTVKKLKAGFEGTLEKVGKVTHYFPKVKAAAVKILKNVKTGDEIYIKGHTTDFKETIASMQLDHVVINEGKKGQEIGLLVKSRVRIGDGVYKI